MNDMKPYYSFPLFITVWNRLQGQSTPVHHIILARWLETSQLIKSPRMLLMAFRSCGKSTLLGLFCVWLLWRDPNNRILIISADLALARKMVRNVKRIIERHPLMASLIPPDIDQWGADRFTIQRDKELRDPSVLAKGISTNLTGTRADIIICDDVEVPRTCETPEKRAMLRERLLELDYILTPSGLMLYAGTPHCWNTIYADAPRPEINEDRIFLEGFVRKVLPIIDEDGLSAWPERFPLEAIDDIRRKSGPLHFKSQMLCEPVNSHAGVLDAQSVRYYDADITMREAAGRWVLSIDGMAIAGCSAWWDPAFGHEGRDRSILAVVLYDHEGRYWVHHIAIIKTNANDQHDAATQQCHQVAEILKTYHIQSVAIETNGLGQFLPGVLRRVLSEEQVGCLVREITSRRPKQLRILEAFDAVLAARQLYVHERVRSTPFMVELQEWRPQSARGHDDCLDAVAGAIHLHPVRLNLPRAARRTPLWGKGQKPIITTNNHFDV